jgi:hypothetical protein
MPAPKDPIQAELWRRKISENTKIAMQDPAILEKVRKPRLTMRGENHPNFGGKLVTPEFIRKQSEAHMNPSEETRKKMRESHLGKKQSKEQIEKRMLHMHGKDHPNFGKHIIPPSRKGIPFTEEQKEYLVLVAPRGVNHWNWKGGVTKERMPYCEKWNESLRERVRAFFSYQCIECGSPQNHRKLCVHHVTFKKDACCSEDTPRYFVPLCTSCHIKTNTNREYWKRHFIEIIEKYYQGKCYFTKEEYYQLKNGYL